MPLSKTLHRVVVVAVVGAGCASGAASKQDVSQLRRHVDNLRHQTSRDQRVIRELENRIFVLEDKLETAQVAMSRNGDTPPKLPVIKAKPRPAAPKPQPRVLAPEPLYQDGDVEIVYEGDAAKPSRKRTVLSLNESNARAPKPRRKGYGRRAPRRTPGAGGGPRYDSDGYPILSSVTDSIPGRSHKRGADPVSVYKTAFLALNARQHETAIKTFRKFLSKWPNHDYADNSQYWMAEAYYDQRQYETALIEFRRVVQTFPTGNKAPDALLKIGYCYAKLADLGSARDVLSQVVEIYPRTKPAKLAAARLSELRK